ncbi:MAG: DNA-binding protein [Clostridia bacterium]|nr:DNA-binding protein [Clostridia bacterium]
MVYTHAETEEMPVFEKDLRIAFLLDFYGDVLSEHERRVLEMYYCDDLSLGEIAEHEGISRQGVRHTVKKGEEELLRLEERLGLARQSQSQKDEAKQLLALAERLERDLTQASASALANEAKRLAYLILDFR